MLRRHGVARFQRPAETWVLRRLEAGGVVRGMCLSDRATAYVN